MEVAAQGELEGRLSGEARQSMDESDIWEWIRQLSRGLYDIHEQMIAHCDLKPQNILLAAPGSKIKIADFGLALKLRRGRRSFSKRGTPSYMAPEVHALPDRDCNKGEKSQDVNPDKGGSNSAADVPVSNGFSFNADVWSLGVIICRFCTPNGRLPNFSGAENEIGDKLCIMDAVEAELSESLKKSGVNFSHRIETVIRATIVEDPSKRLTSSELFEMVESLTSDPQGLCGKQASTATTRGHRSSSSWEHVKRKMSHQTSHMASQVHQFFAPARNPLLGGVEDTRSDLAGANELSVIMDEAIEEWRPSSSSGAARTEIGSRRSTVTTSTGRLGVSIKRTTPSRDVLKRATSWSPSESLRDDEGSDWAEAIDPESGAPYYYNTITGASSWERPAVMGEESFGGSQLVDKSSSELV